MGALVIIMLEIISLTEMLLDNAIGEKLAGQLVVCVGVEIEISRKIVRLLMIALDAMIFKKENS